MPKEAEKMPDSTPKFNTSASKRAQQRRADVMDAIQKAIAKAEGRA